MPCRYTDVIATAPACKLQTLLGKAENSLMNLLVRALIAVAGLGGIALVSHGKTVVGLVILVPVFVVVILDINRRDRVLSARRDREIEDLRVRATALTPDARGEAFARIADLCGSRRTPQMRALRRELGQLEGGLGTLPPPRDALFRLRDPAPRPHFHPPCRFLVRTLVVYPAISALVVLVAGLLENLSDPTKVGIITTPLIVAGWLTMLDADKLDAGSNARVGWSLASATVTLLAVCIVLAALR